MRDGMIGIGFRISELAGGVGAGEYPGKKLFLNADWGLERSVVPVLAG